MRILLLEHPREASEAHFNDIANTPLWSCLMTGYTGAAPGPGGLRGGHCRCSALDVCANCAVVGG